MNAIVVVGMGFGDEGKGALVDSLCERYKADLVVRTGAHQAAHNVIRGSHHTFSQFGSGTLYGSRTYLDKDMLIEPIAMNKEACALTLMGIKPYSLLTVHPDCPVTTWYHKAANARCQKTIRDGTCGVGIWETRKHSRSNEYLRAKDLKCFDTILNKLELIDEYYCDFPSPYILEFAKELYEFSKNIKIGEQPDSKFTIFEGSQGVLLDENKGTVPHVTGSTITTERAEEICKQNNLKYEVVGVIRSYHTRHGNGPFGEECYIKENHNSGGMAGIFRRGPFSKKWFDFACNIQSVNSIFINHLDKCPENPNNIMDYVRSKHPIKGLGFGPSSNEKVYL